MVPVSAIFSRKIGNCFSNSLRFFMKTCTKFELGFRRLEKLSRLEFYRAIVGNLSAR